MFVASLKLVQCTAAILSVNICTSATYLWLCKSAANLNVMFL